mmetsp:Transcript_37029/g.82319  ORF Transcript_37029/g.82319 Transcript_37029/m.82319 type:complete len:94 (-) Transcript_37029:727-1008(-)
MASGSGRRSWQHQAWNSALTVWASLGKWERRGAVAGFGLILIAGAMTLDTTLLREKEYQDWWEEKQDQNWAEELQFLLRPEKAPRNPSPSPKP